MKSPSPLGEGRGEGAQPKDAHVVLTQTVITTEMLKHKLQGVTRVSVPERAVVTPSVQELPKERNIELVRGKPGRHAVRVRKGDALRWLAAPPDGVAVRLME